MIYLLAGHSKSKKGAFGNGIDEAEWAIKARDTITKYLRTDYELSVWNDSDTDDLSTVIQKLSKVVKSTDLVIDIHLNTGQSSATGVECYVRDKESDIVVLNLAKELCNNISAILSIRNRSIKSEKSSQHTRLGVLHTGARSILLEVFFLSNKDDVNKATVNEYVLFKRLAEIIAKYSKMK